MSFLADNSTAKLPEPTYRRVSVFLQQVSINPKRGISFLIPRCILHKSRTSIHFFDITYATDSLTDGGISLVINVAHA